MYQRTLLFHYTRQFNRIYTMTQEYINHGSNIFPLLRIETPRNVTQSLLSFLDHNREKALSSHTGDFICSCHVGDQLKNFTKRKEDESILLFVLTVLTNELFWRK